jgi:hypothetical protein
MSQFLPVIQRVGKDPRIASRFAKGKGIELKNEPGCGSCPRGTDSLPIPLEKVHQCRPLILTKPCVDDSALSLAKGYQDLLHQPLARTEVVHQHARTGVERFCQRPEREVVNAVREDIVSGLFS